MPTHKPDLAELSISQLVALSGMAPQTVSKRIAAAHLKPVRMDGKTLYYTPREALRAMYQEGALDPQAEKARLDAVRADLAELELEERRGSLLRKQDCDRAWSAECTAVRQRLRGLPKRLAVTVPGFTATAAKASLVVIDEALRELSGVSSGARSRTRGARRKKDSRAA